MKSISQPREEIRLAAIGHSETAALLPWLRAALPGKFLLEAGEGVAGGQRHILVYPGLTGHVARGLAQGEPLGDLIGAWLAIAEDVLSQAGDGSFALAAEAPAADPAGVAGALAAWAGGQPEKETLPVLESSDDPLTTLLIASLPGFSKKVAPVLKRLAAQGAGLPFPASLRADLVESAAAEAARVRAGLVRETTARREAQEWLGNLRSSLWSEGERAAQAEARLRSAESSLRLLSQQAPAPAPAPVVQTATVTLPPVMVPDPRVEEELNRVSQVLEQTTIALTERDAYIQRVHTSKSWRVTEPLRSLSRILRREPR